jgi:hypothetical protein
VAYRRWIEVSALHCSLVGDLDWIVSMAISKNRDERYGSAAELADDVKRHLADEPVVAGPPSVRYRLGKLVRRHRAAVGAAAVALIALLLGTVGTTIGMLKARNEAESARRTTCPP